MDIVKKAVLADSGGGLYTGDLITADFQSSVIADYSNEFGSQELRASYVENQYENSISPENVLVTSGVKEGLLLLALLFQGEGNRVGIADIAWPGFSKIFGGMNYYIEYYRYNSVHSIEEISKTCSILVVNNPHNPTGFFFSDVEMQRIIEIAKRNGCLLVVDECLFHYSFGECNRFPIQIESTNVVVVDSLSKWAGMPGLRVGFINTHRSLIEELMKIKCKFLNPVSSVAQKTAERNMERLSKWAVDENKSSMDMLAKVSNLFVREGYEIVGCLVQYMWIKTGMNVEDSKLSIKGREFKVVKGETFGAENHYARFNYRQCERALKELV